MELKGSKTEANLQAAFAGESMARNKYTYYASKAKKEGYNIIADKFEQTANNEKEHAKIWFKLLHNEEIPSTIENLKDAADRKRLILPPLGIIHIVYHTTDKFFDCRFFKFWR